VHKYVLRNNNAHSLLYVVSH